MAISIGTHQMAPHTRMPIITECGNSLVIDENSDCLSVKRVICDKMEVRSVQIFIPYERTKDHLTQFSGKEEWLVGATFYVTIFGQPAPVGAKSPIFDLFARNVSAVTPSEKVHLTLIGSLLRAFQ